MDVFKNQKRIKDFPNTVFEDMKKVCYVKLPTTSDIEQIKYKLPDGRILDMAQIAHQTGNMLFNETYDLAYQTYSCIQETEESYRKKLFESIVTAGGTTLLKGFGKRLQYELTHTLGKYSTVHVLEGPETQRHNASWLGASILSSLSTFESLWVTKEQYEEHGANIILKSCVL